MRLLPALGAALVDIGGDRPAFLPQSEILPRGRRLDEGERVVVQIRREAQGGKAARLTTRIVLGGTIVGPAEAGRAAPDELRRRWNDIAERAAHLDPPARLHPPASFAAALAGILPRPERIFVDDPGAVPEIRAAFPGIDVAHEAEAEWPIDPDALFEEALSPTMALAGGGSIHLEATRAATLIDVDSGTPETGSPERVALAVNLAAADAIAHEIRKRNLGGGIVIDFVGLDSPRLREQVRAAVALALQPDPARPQILGWTRLGHLELVRPRRGRPLAEALLEPAHGGALVKSALTVAHEALRALRRRARAQPGNGWHLTVAPEVAAALASEAANALRALETRFGRAVAVAVDVDLGRDRFQIAPV